MQEDPATYTLVGQDPLRLTVEAFAVRRGEPGLVDYLNAWIEAVRAEGFLPLSRLYWFATDDWAARLAAAPAAQ